MSLPKGKGRILVVKGEAVVAARCPMCGNEHRYAKGAVNGEDIVAIRRCGFTDEWLPCQADLPGNFWRIVIGGHRQGGTPTSDQPGHGGTVP